MRKTGLLMALMLALPVTTRAGEPFALAPGGDGVQRSPAAAHGGGVWLVVWQDGWSGDGGNSNIRGVLIGKGAVPGTPFTICGAAGNQELPRVAAAKDGFFVAWQDYRGRRDADVYAAFVTRDGKVRHPKGIAVAEGAGTQCHPDVGSNGARCLVVWELAAGSKPCAIRARRLDAAGRPADPKPLSLGPGRSPAVTHGSSAGKYLAVWKSNAGRMRTVEGILVPDAGLPGKPFTVMQVCSDAPSVAAGENGFVVVASCRPAPNAWGWGGPAAFVSARVGLDGTAPDARVTYGYYNKELAARSKANILDSSQWKRSPNIWPAGKVGGFPGTHDDRWPHLWSSIAPRGHGFVAVWVSRKIRNRWRLHDADLFGSGFTTDPVRVAKVGGAPVAATEQNESRPQLASDGSRLLLVYETVDAKGRLRVVGRWDAVRDGPPTPSSRQ